MAYCEPLDHIIYGSCFFSHNLMSVFSKQEQEELKAPTHPIQVFQKLPSDHRQDKSMLFFYMNNGQKLRFNKVLSTNYLCLHVGQTVSLAGILLS